VGVQEKVQLGLGFAELEHALGVLVHRAAELLDDAGLAGVEGLAGRVALGLDEDLRAGVASQYGTPLDQGRLRPQACRGHRRHGARQAPADHHGVVRAHALELSAHAAVLGPSGVQRTALVGRPVGRLVAEHEHVAAPVMAGQVAQADFQIARRQLVRAAVFPSPPFGLALPKDLRKALAAQDNLEPAWAMLGVPISHAGPEPVLAGGGDCGPGHRVLDRPVQPDGQQIRRAHLVDELGVVDPAAQLAETLGLDPDRGGGGCAGRGQEQGARQKRWNCESHGDSPSMA